MLTAYTTVPIPTVPPSSHPASSTVPSMPVRTTRIECPRAAMPVISPSRGPGPSPAPMYRPVATPFSATPLTITTTRTGSAWGGGMVASTRSITPPTMTTLHSVPMPGRCRSGTHSSSTATPTMTDHVPVCSPIRRASPWCSTSHGSTPSPASSSIESLTPYSTSPENSWTRRRNIPPRWQAWLYRSSATFANSGLILS
jgi:hypothetical protein